MKRAARWKKFRSDFIIPKRNKIKELRCNAVRGHSRKLISFPLSWSLPATASTNHFFQHLLYVQDSWLASERPSWSSDTVTQRCNAPGSEKTGFFFSYPENEPLIWLAPLARKIYFYSKPDRFSIYFFLFYYK